MAKGTITTMSCNPATNGFQFTEDYVTGPGGEELSMLNGSGTWQRTNVYGGGKLIGTYDLVHNPAYTPGGSQPQQVPWLHLHLEDALGTRRMQVSGMLANLAQPEMDFQSLPYGDGFSQSRPVRRRNLRRLFAAALHRQRTGYRIRKRLLRGQVLREQHGPVDVARLEREV